MGDTGVIRVEPEELLFTGVKLNQAYRQEVKLTNTLGTSLEVNLRAGSPDRYTVSPNHIRIPGHGSATVDIRLKVLKFANRKKAENLGQRDLFHIKSIYHEQRFQSVFYLAPPDDENTNPQVVRGPARDGTPGAAPGEMGRASGSSAPAPEPRTGVPVERQRDLESKVNELQRSLREREAHLERALARQTDEIQDRDQRISTLEDRLDAAQSYNLLAGSMSSSSSPGGTEDLVGASSSEDDAHPGRTTGGRVSGLATVDFAIEEAMVGRPPRPHGGSGRRTSASERELQGANAHLRARVESLTQDLERARQDATQLERVQAELRRSAPDLPRAVEEAVARERAASETRDARVLEVLRAKDAELAAREEQVHAGSRQISALQSTLQEVRARLADSMAAREELEVECEDLRAQVGAAGRERAAMEDVLAAEEAGRAQLRALSEERQVAGGAAEVECARLQGMVNAARREAAERAGEAESLRARLSAQAEEHHSAAEASAARVEGIVRDHAAAAAESQREVDQLRQTVRELRARFVDGAGHSAALAAASAPTPSAAAGGDHGTEVEMLRLRVRQLQRENESLDAAARQAGTAAASSAAGARKSDGGAPWHLPAPEAGRASADELRARLAQAEALANERGERLAQLEALQRAAQATAMRTEEGLEEVHQRLRKSDRQREEQLADAHAQNVRLSARVSELALAEQTARVACEHAQEALRKHREASEAEAGRLSRELEEARHSAAAAASRSSAPPGDGARGRARPSRSASPAGGRGAGPSSSHAREEHLGSLVREAEQEMIALRDALQESDAARRAAEAELHRARGDSGGGGGGGGGTLEAAETRVAALEETVRAMEGGGGDAHLELARARGEVHELRRSEARLRSELQLAEERAAAAETGLRGARAGAAGEVASASARALFQPGGASAAHAAAGGGGGGGGGSGDADYRRDNSLIAQLAVRAEEAEAEVGRLASQLEFAEEAAAMRARSGGEALGHAGEAARAQQDRNGHLHRQVLRLEGEVRALKQDRELHKVEEGRMRARLADAAHEVAAAQTQLAERDRALHDAREEACSARASLAVASSEGAAAAARQVAEADRARESADAARAAESGELRAARGEVSRLQAALESLRAASSRKVEKLEGAARDSASEAAASRKDAESKGSQAEQLRVQVSILMETVETLQAGETGEREQRVVSLTAQVVAAKGVEAQLERRVVELTTSLEGRSQRLARAEEATELAAASCREAEARARAAEGQVEASKREMASMRSELTAREGAASGAERRAHALAGDVKRVEGELAAARGAAEKQRRRHAEQVAKERADAAQRLRAIRQEGLEQALRSSPGADSGDRWVDAENSPRLVAALQELAAAVRRPHRGARHSMAPPPPGGGDAGGAGEDGGWLLPVVERLRGMLLEQERLLSRAQSEGRIARGELAAEEVRARLIEAELDRRTSQWEEAAAELAAARDSASRRRALDEVHADRREALRDRRVASLAKELEAAHTRLVGSEAAAESSRAEAVEQRSLAEARGRKLALADAELLGARGDIEARVAEESEDTGGADGPGTTLAVPGAVAAAAGDRAARMQRQHTAALHDYFESAVAKALVIPAADDRLMAVTRELCALKLAERGLLSSLHASRIREAAARAQAASLGEVVRRMEAQAEEALRDGASSPSLSPSPSSVSPTAPPPPGPSAAELSAQLAAARHESFLLQDEALLARQKVSELDLEVRELEAEAAAARASAERARSERESGVQRVREELSAAHAAEIESLQAELDGTRQQHADTILAQRASATVALREAEEAAAEAMASEMVPRPRYDEAAAVAGRAGQAERSAARVREENASLLERVTCLERDNRGLREDNELQARAFVDLEKTLARLERGGRAGAAAPSSPAPGAGGGAMSGGARRVPSPDRRAGEHAGLARQLVQVKLAEAGAQRKLRVAARAELELREQLARRDERIAELKAQQLQQAKPAARGTTPKRRLDASTPPARSAPGGAEPRTPDGRGGGGSEDGGDEAADLRVRLAQREAEVQRLEEALAGAVATGGGGAGGDARSGVAAAVEALKSELTSAKAEARRFRARARALQEEVSAATAAARAILGLSPGSGSRGGTPSASPSSSSSGGGSPPDSAAPAPSGAVGAVEGLVRLLREKDAELRRARAAARKAEKTAAAPGPSSRGGAGGSDLEAAHRAVVRDLTARVSALTRERGELVGERDRLAERVRALKASVGSAAPVVDRRPGRPASPRSSSAAGPHHQHHHHGGAPEVRASSQAQQAAGFAEWRPGSRGGPSPSGVAMSSVPESSGYDTEEASSRGVVVRHEASVQAGGEWGWGATPRPDVDSAGLPGLAELVGLHLARGEAALGAAADRVDAAAHRVSVDAAEGVTHRPVDGAREAADGVVVSEALAESRAEVAAALSALRVLTDAAAAAIPPKPAPVPAAVSEPEPEPEEPPPPSRPPPPPPAEEVGGEVVEGGQREVDLAELQQMVLEGSVRPEVAVEMFAGALEARLVEREQQHQPAGAAAQGAEGVEQQVRAAYQDGFAAGAEQGRRWHLAAGGGPGEGVVGGEVKVAVPAGPLHEELERLSAGGADLGTVRARAAEGVALARAEAAEQVAEARGCLAEARAEAEASAAKAEAARAAGVEAARAEGKSEAAAWRGRAQEAQVEARRLAVEASEAAGRLAEAERRATGAEASQAAAEERAKGLRGEIKTARKALDAYRARAPGAGSPAEGAGSRSAPTTPARERRVSFGDRSPGAPGPPSRVAAVAAEAATAAQRAVEAESRLATELSRAEEDRKRAASEAQRVTQELSSVRAELESERTERVKIITTLRDTVGNLRASGDTEGRMRHEVVRLSVELAEAQAMGDGALAECDRLRAELLAEQSSGAVRAEHAREDVRARAAETESRLRELEARLVAAEGRASGVAEAAAILRGAPDDFAREVAALEDEAEDMARRLAGVEEAAFRRAAEAEEALRRRALEEAARLAAQAAAAQQQQQPPPPPLPLPSGPDPAEVAGLRGEVGRLGEDVERLNEEVRRQRRLAAEARAEADAEGGRAAGLRSRATEAEERADAAEAQLRAALREAEERGEPVDAEAALAREAAARAEAVEAAKAREEAEREAAEREAALALRAEELVGAREEVESLTRALEDLRVRDAEQREADAVRALAAEEERSKVGQDLTAAVEAAQLRARDAEAELAAERSRRGASRGALERARDETRLARESLDAVRGEAEAEVEGVRAEFNRYRKVKDKEVQRLISRLQRMAAAADKAAASTLSGGAHAGASPSPGSAVVAFGRTSGSPAHSLTVSGVTPRTRSGAAARKRRARMRSKARTLDPYRGSSQSGAEEDGGADGFAAGGDARSPAPAISSREASDAEEDEGGRRAAGPSPSEGASQRPPRARRQPPSPRPRAAGPATPVALAAGAESPEAGDITGSDVGVSSSKGSPEEGAAGAGERPRRPPSPSAAMGEAVREARRMAEAEAAESTLPGGEGRAARLARRIRYLAEAEDLRGMAREAAMEREEKERLQGYLEEAQEQVARLRRKLERARVDLREQAATAATDVAAARDSATRLRQGTLSPEEAEKLREKLRRAEEQARAHKAEAGRRAKALGELKEQTSPATVEEVRRMLAEAVRGREAADEKCKSLRASLHRKEQMLREMRLKQEELTLAAYEGEQGERAEDSRRAQDAHKIRTLQLAGARREQHIREMEQEVHELRASSLLPEDLVKQQEAQITVNKRLRAELARKDGLLRAQQQRGEAMGGEMAQALGAAEAAARREARAWKVAGGEAAAMRARALELMSAVRVLSSLLLESTASMRQAAAATAGTSGAAAGGEAASSRSGPALRIPPKPEAVDDIASMVGLSEEEVSNIMGVGAGSPRTKARSATAMADGVLAFLLTRLEGTLCSLAGVADGKSPRGQGAVEDGERSWSDAVVHELVTKAEQEAHAARSALATAVASLPRMDGWVAAAIGESIVEARERRVKRERDEIQAEVAGRMRRTGGGYAGPSS